MRYRARVATITRAKVAPESIDCRSGHFSASCLTLSLGQAMAHAPRSEFKPFVPPSRRCPNSPARRSCWGIIFGIILGASTVYLALRAGLTGVGVHSNCRAGDRSVQAFGKSTILENNIVPDHRVAASRSRRHRVTLPGRWIFLADGERYFSLFHHPER